MIAHPDHQNWATAFVVATVAVFSRLVDLGNNGFVSRDLVRLVLLVPLNPLSPKLFDFSLIKFTGYAKAGDGSEIGVELMSGLQLWILLLEDCLKVLLESLDL